jgi:hypothetical protein
MTPVIVILEDNAERQTAMNSWLDDRLPMYVRHVSSDPDRIIAIFREHWASILIASLDFDLYDDPEMGTHKTGGNVVDYLTTRTDHPFPVLVHSSNEPEAERMQRRLRKHHWATDRVIPFDGTEWIGHDWYPALKRMIRTAARDRKPIAGHDDDADS